MTLSKRVLEKLKSLPAVWGALTRLFGETQDPRAICAAARVHVYDGDHHFPTHGSCASAVVFAAPS